MHSWAGPQAAEMLAHPLTDPSLAAAAGDVADPLGAAVLARTTSFGAAAFTRDVERFADRWLAQHGVEFAARAVVETAGLTICQGDEPGQWYLRRAVDGDGASDWDFSCVWIARRVRAYCTVITDRDYEAVVGTLGDSRSKSITQRVAASYLVPTQRSWIAEDCKTISASEDETSSLVLANVTSSAELRQVMRHVPGYVALEIPGLLYSLAEGAGGASAWAVATWLDRTGSESGKRRRLLLDVLSQLPTDEAFEILLDRHEQSDVLTAISQTAQRFPQRARRLAMDRSDTLPQSVLNMLL